MAKNKSKEAPAKVIVKKEFDPIAFNDFNINYSKATERYTLTEAQRFILSDVNPEAIYNHATLVYGIKQEEWKKIKE
jgi:hypothetical protein